MQAAPASLQKQEQIKGPENAPIARFDALGCYQTRSEIRAVFRRLGVWASGRLGVWAAGLRFECGSNAVRLGSAGFGQGG